MLFVDKMEKTKLWSTLQEAQKLLNYSGREAPAGLVNNVALEKYFVESKRGS